MRIKESGKENSKKIMLIPGNFCCWRVFSDLISRLSDRYHIIAVSLDGYDETGKTEFTPFEFQAKKLIRAVKERYGGHIDLLLGESIGGGVAIYMARSSEITIGATVLNGPESLDFGIFTPLLLSFFAAGQQKALSAISGEGFVLPDYALKMMGMTQEKLSGITSGMAKGITKNSVLASDREGMLLYSKAASFEPVPEANVHCWYGEKEGNMKKALKELYRLFPHMQEYKFSGFGHGELLLNPDIMADEIDKLIKEL